MPEVSPSGAANAAKGTLSEAINVVAKYILPLVFVLAGFFAAPYLGGSGPIANVLVNSSANIGNEMANRVGGGVMAIIWAGIGYAFWSFGHGDGIVQKIIGRSVGGFFFGAALGNVPVVVSGKGAARGVIGDLVGGAGDIARGG